MLKKDKLYQDWCVFLVLLGISVIVVLQNSIILYCVHSSVLLGIICLKARYSFFSAISFILVFSLFQTLVQSLTGNARGMIYNAIRRIPLYEGIHGLCTISFLLTLLFFILFTNLITNEKNIYQTEIIMTNATALIFIIVAVTIIILMFPSFPDFKLHIATRRSQGILNNYGWVLTALILAGLTVDMAWKMKYLWLSYFFIAFWIFGHAERVECLGFIIYIVLKILNKKEKVSSTTNYGEQSHQGIINGIGKKIFLFGGLFALFALLIVLGVYRDASRTSRVDYSISNVLRNLFVQATAGDVIYVFDCAVDMWKRGNLLKGVTYLDWILNFLPGSSPQYQAARYIKKWYFTMGGALFFTEPMMNFGIIGVLVTNIIFCLFYSFVLKKKSLFRAMVFVPMVIEIFRTAWYGRNGWQLASFIEVPLIYLGMKLVTNRIRFSIK